MDKKALAIQECVWSEVREQFKIEPQLLEIIDSLALDNDYPLFKVSYPFGATIFESGVFYLPTQDKKVLPITDSKIPHSIQAQLNYNSFPLGFITGSGGIEVFSEIDESIFSLAYFERGLNLGIWEMFAPPTPFHVVAGARSLCLLPKITDIKGHTRLKQHYGISHSAPNKSFEQWYIFKEIANHQDFSQQWSCDIFFFSAKWMQKIKRDPKWLAFNNFILKKAWKHTEHSRNKMVFDTVLGTFSRILTKRRLKPSSYIVDTLKHLIFIATGAIPAFAPAIDNSAAPIDGLLKVYLEEYGLKTYAPSMMQPHHFSIDTPGDFAYYALQVPTYLESIPKYRTSYSTRIDLAELISLMDLFMKELLSHNLGDSIHDTYNLLSKIQFDYFHSEEDKDTGIYPTSDLAEEDTHLLYMPKGYETQQFCKHSTFARGCVRISRKID